MHARSRFVTVRAVFLPLHESPAFTRQTDAYQRLGQRAWSDGIVPWRLSTCPLLADVEAEVIAAFANGGPVTVIDVGAGTGRLGFHLAPRLEAKGVNALVTLTDVVEENVRAVSTHPQLSALAQRGLVAFSSFDALRPPVLEGPTVLLAHYLFDTLPHRAFRRRASGDSELLFDAESWSWSEVPSPLPAALANRGEGTFLVPVGAARALEAWTKACTGPLLVLAADKGVTALGPNDEPKLARHESVSAGVDFEALTRMTSLKHFGPRAPDSAFELHAFVSQSSASLWTQRAQENEPLVMLRSFERLLSTGGTGDELLHFLEASLFDADLTAQLSTRLRETNWNEAQRGHLVTCLLSAARAHFTFKQQLDVPFHLATVAHHLGALELASALYRASLEESGAHATTLVNLALAQHALGQTTVAKQAIDLALTLEPDHQRASQLKSQWQ